MKVSVLRASTAGLLAWLIYGVVEFILACVFRVFSKHDVEMLPWQWPVIGLIFGAYAAGGLLIGGASGVCLAWMGKGQPGRHHETVASLSLVVAFVMNLASAWPLARSEEAAVAVAIGLGLLFSAAVIWEAWQRRSGFLANPWVVSLLLLAVPWVNREAFNDRSTMAKAGISLLALGVIVAVAAAIDRMRSGNLVRPQWRALTAAAAMGILCTAVLVSSSAPTVHASQAPGSASSGKPNILMIVMDTVRADHLSVYGYDRNTTPHLRDFARHATVYNRAVAGSDMTLPSHASMFTGAYPSWHGAHTGHADSPFGRPLAPGAVTLAEVLRAQGYWTGAAVANHSFLQAPMGLAQGFAHWDHSIPVNLSRAERPFYLREGLRSVLSLVGSTTDFDGYFLRAEDINRRAFKWLEDARKRGPLFLFLNYMDAHIPYVPPPPFRSAFPGRDPDFRPAADHQSLTTAVNDGTRHVSESEREHLISQYDGGIAYTDAEIGKLFARLREMGLYDNTLIVITADHGEAFGERDRMQHGIASVYQDQVHVPLLVKYPGQQDAQSSDALASHVDLMPTVLDVAGYKAPSGMQGRSLRLPRQSEAEAVFSEAGAIGNRAANSRLRGFRRALYAGSWKLITWTAGNPELYDLAADPGESKNLYRPDDPLAQKLHARMTEWMAAIPKQQGNAAKPDKSTLERIKSLGYVQ